MRRTIVVRTVGATQATIGLIRPARRAGRTAVVAVGQGTTTVVERAVRARADVVMGHLAGKAVRVAPGTIGALPRAAGAAGTGPTGAMTTPRAPVVGVTVNGPWVVARMTGVRTTVGRARAGRTVMPDGEMTRRAEIEAVPVVRIGMIVTAAQAGTIAATVKADRADSDGPIPRLVAPILTTAAARGQ